MHLPIPRRYAYLPYLRRNLVEINKIQNVFDILLYKIAEYWNTQMRYVNKSWQSWRGSELDIEVSAKRSTYAPN